MRNIHSALLVLGMAVTLPVAFAQDEHAGHDMSGTAAQAAGGQHQHGAQVAEGGQMCAQGGHQGHGQGPHHYRHGQHGQGGCGGAGHQHGAGGQCAAQAKAEPGA